MRGRGKNSLRLVKSPARSPAASTMIEAAIDFANSETKNAQMIGCLVIGFYADGATNRTIHRPSAHENRMGRDMFDAWAKQSVSAALTHSMAHAVAADVVNRSNGFIDDGGPAA